jgi:hypothetical protein
MIMAEVHCANPIRARQINETVFRRATRVKLANEKFGQPPTLQDIPGEVPVGSIVDATSGGEPAPFRLAHTSLNRGLNITGQSGTGKTTCVRKMIRGLDESIGVFVMDPKDDYAEAPGMACFGSLEWCWNPTERFTWLPPEHRISLLIEIMIESFGLLEASRAFLTRVLKEMDRRYPRGQITLHDFHARLAKVRPRSPREGQVKEASLNKLDGLLSGCGTVFACAEGVHPADIFNSRIVLSQFGLQSSASYFLSNSILARLMAYSRTHGLRGDRLRLVVLAEEARIILFDRNRERRFEVSVPQSSVMASTCREFGIGLIVCDNLFNGLSEACRTNADTLISFRQAGTNVRAVAAAMNLNPEQMDELMNLKVGEAIVRTSAWRWPFKIRVEETDGPIR